MITTLHPRRTGRIVPLTLTRDGRVARPTQLDRLAKEAGTATDCFVFCQGWLHDEAEAYHEASRFFALLDQALAPLRGRVAPLHLALHWPSKPFANGEPATGGRAAGQWPEIERHVGDRVLGPGEHSAVARVLEALHAAEIPQSAEEEAELDLLARRLDTARRVRGMQPLSPFHALGFWVMKRRAGEVGERLGRETLAPLWRSLPRAPRLHLVGHSFGAKLVSSIVLGGVEPESLTLLLAAFSAFAFAPEVPGFGGPGFYHRVLAERRVARGIVVLRSDHDTALATLYRAMSGSGEVGRDRGARGNGSAGPRHYGAAQVSQCGRAGYRVAGVATSALGAVGARGVGAPEIDLADAQRIGLPRYPIVNVDGSRVVRARDAFVGAHRDLHHAEVANLVLLAAGLLTGGPDGIRPVPVDPRLRP